MRRLVGFLSVLPLLLAGQSSPPAQRSQTIEVALERNEHGAWHTIDPGLVLDSGDLIRFRFHTSFPGYVYVVNSGTSGTQSLLFPGDATGRNNRVQASKDYFVPATGASFKVAGPAGQDIVYWLVSPLALGGNPAATLPSETHEPLRMTPRCDDSIFRARGLCIDSSAGPRNVRGEEALPDALSSVPNLTRRELVIVQNQGQARVSSPDVAAGPLLYEFRVAHR